MNIRTCCVTVSLGLVLFGCTTDETDVSEVSQAFTEASCGTSAPDAAFAGDTKGGFSIETPYTYNHPGCYKSYVIDIYNLPVPAFVGSDHDLFVRWDASAPTTESACNGNSMKIEIYDHAGNPHGIAGTSATWNGSSCDMGLLEWAGGFKSGENDQLVAYPGFVSTDLGHSFQGETARLVVTARAPSTATRPLLISYGVNR